MVCEFDSPAICDLDEQFTGLVSDWLAEGLRTGDACLAIATAPHLATLDCCYPRSGFLAAPQQTQLRAICAEYEVVCLP